MPLRSRPDRGSAPLPECARQPVRRDVTIPPRHEGTVRPANRVPEYRYVGRSRAMGGSASRNRAVRGDRGPRSGSFSGPHHRRGPTVRRNEFAKPAMPGFRIERWVSGMEEVGGIRHRLMSRHRGRALGNGGVPRRMSIGPELAQELLTAIVVQLEATIQMVVAQAGRRGSCVRDGVFACEHPGVVAATGTDAVGRHATRWGTHSIRNRVRRFGSETDANEVGRFGTACNSGSDHAVQGFYRWHRCSVLPVTSHHEGTGHYGSFLFFGVRRQTGPLAMRR